MNKDELCYDYAKLSKEEQENSRRHFDMMATAILAIAGALIGAIVFGDFKESFIAYSHYLLIGTLASFSVCALFAIKVLRLRNWKFNPPLTDLYTHIMSDEYSDDDLLLWTAKQISDVIPYNAKVLRTKAISLCVSYIAFALEVVMLGILIITS